MVSAARAAEPLKLLLLPARVWAAGVGDRGSQGARYLAARGVWRAQWPWPASVRWLPAVDAPMLRPRLPDRAAGALLYRYRAHGEDRVGAVSVEAVDGAGRRVSFGGAKRPVERPSVSGSRYAAECGERLFEVGGPDRDGAVWLVQGPLDALAVVALARAGWWRRGVRRVLAAHSAGGLARRVLVGVDGPLVVGPRGDSKGLEPARMARQAAVEAGIDVEWQPAGRRAAGEWIGWTWADLAADVFGGRAL
ncbi:MAG: hypothetical protein OXG72_01755 [Acidobacteria bacterium]|nr:hypothetical protein [Acidobacteriota bacterium]